MASEGRRQTNEFMKEILHEGAIESLVGAFACTLPASRQLLAQLRCVRLSVLCVVSFLRCFVLCYVLILRLALSHLFLSHCLSLLTPHPTACVTRASPSSDITPGRKP
jgi:hypothetical protein